MLFDGKVWRCDPVRAKAKISEMPPCAVQLGQTCWLFPLNTSQGSNIKNLAPVPADQSLTVLLFMAVFAQALFALVRCNFMAFTFFSARHTRVKSYEL